jgi:hypothetical protein
MRQPVMNITERPVWNFFRGVCLFIYKSLHKNKPCNLSGVLQIEPEFNSGTEWLKYTK